MILAREISICMPELQRNLGDETGATMFAYQGRLIPCVVSTLRKDHTLTEGGQILNVVCSVIMRDADLQGVTLNVGKIGVIRGVRYRVAAVNVQPGTGTSSCDLIDPNQN